MIEPKVIFVDLDGTILKDYHSIQEDNLRVLKEINKSGIPVCIVTGRSYKRCKHFYEELELSTPLCVFNGSYVFNPQDENYPNFVGGVDKDVLISFLNNLSLQIRSNSPTNSYIVGSNLSLNWFNPWYLLDSSNLPVTPFISQ